MKLRINTKLRAALIAAFTAVAFTLPQTQAAATVVTLGEIGTQASHDFVTDSYVLNATNSATCNLTDGSVLTMTTTTKFWGTKSDSTLTGTWTNSAALDDMNSTLGSGFVADDFSAGINYCFTAPGNQNSVASLSVDGSLYTADSSTITMYVTVAARGYTMNNFSVTGLTDATVSYATNGGDGFSSSAAFSDGAAAITMIKIEGTLNGSDIRMTSTTARNGWQTISYVISGAPAPVEDPVWTGSESEVWDTTTANWKNSQGATTFTSGKNAVFNADATTTEVSIGEAIQAGKVTVDGASYTFAIGDGGSLSASKVDLTGTGASLTVTGVEGDADTVTISTLTGTGDLTVGENANVTVSAISSYTGELRMDGGTLTVGSAITRDTLTIANGTLNLGNSKHTIGKLTIDDGGVVTTTHSAGDPCVTGDIEINAGGTFKVIGQHDAFGYNTVTKSITMRGAEDNLATLELNQTTGNSATMGTHIVMNGYSTITSSKEGGSAGFNTYTGISIAAEGVQNNIDVLDMRRNGVTIDVAEDGELTVQKVTLNNDNGTGTVLVKASDGTLFLTGETNLTKGLNITAGTVDMSGTVNMGNLTIGTDGTLTVSDGTTAVSGTGNVLSNTITVAGGELTLNGTYEIGGNTGSMTTDYVGGEVSGNGFERVAGQATVYTVTGGSIDVESATFTVGGQEVTLDNGVYITEGTVNYGTFYVKSDEESLAHALEFAGAHTVDSVSLAAGTTINMDSDGASIALAMQGSATVNATEAATISSISGWENHTLNIDGTSEVTLANLTTLTGSSALEVKGGTLNTKKFVLNSADASLKVNDGTTMNVTGDLTPTLGSVYVAGEVNISGSLDLSNGSKADVDLHIDGAGAVTSAGLWMDTKSSILLDEGGAYSVGSLTFTGKVGDNSSITYVADSGDAYYGTGNSKFTITNASLSATGNVTIGNTLVDCDVLVDGGHTVTLNADADSVTVRDGGTIQIGSGSAAELLIENGGIVGGSVEVSQAKIAAGNTATFAEGLDDSDSAVMFFAGDDVEVQVTNNSGEAAAYNGIANEDMKVTAGTMMSVSTEDIVVDNSLVIDSVVNYDMAGALTINTIDTDALAGIENYGGQVTLMNIGTDPIELADVTITADSIVALYQGATVAPEQEATVTIAAEGVLTAGGGTLLANLEMADGSAMVLFGETVTLGSALTMGQNILLDSTTMQALDALEIGDTHWLVQAAEGTQLSYNGDAEWYGQVFSRSSLDGDYDLIGDFNIVFDETNGFGLTKFSNVPEPTTGTLSLLALAALAARRRKHN